MSNELINSRTVDQMIPAVGTWNLMKDQATILVKSGFLPDQVKTPEQALTLILKGRELGIPPMVALSKIYVIKGNPTCASELMLALIYQRVKGAVIEYVKNDDISCRIKTIRPGHSEQIFEFSYEDAKRAGITGNATWTKYRRAMLRARCISEMARAVYPDAIMGLSYTHEEMGAEVDENEEIINVEAKSVSSPVDNFNNQLDDEPNIVSNETSETPNQPIESFNDIKNDRYPNGLTHKQIIRLYAIVNEAPGWDKDSARRVLKEVFKVDSSTDLTRTDYDILCDQIKGGMSPYQMITEASEI